MSVHVIARDGTCAVCGTAQAHGQWVEAKLAGYAARSADPAAWMAAVRARTAAFEEDAR